MSLEVDAEAQAPRGQERTANSEAQEWSWAKRLRQSSHPVATLFYTALRVASLVFYMLGSLFIRNHSLLFIIVTLLIAADFWNVKNVAGRLLVGLRWWNEASSDGSSTWVFETADPQRYINPIDSKLFWMLLYAVPAVWVVFGLIALLKLNIIWFLAVVIGLVLSLTNTFAFSRCDKFAKANNIISDVSNGLLSRLFGTLGSRLFK